MNNTVFSAMDLNHIGAFGHSIGARAVADIVHQYPSWFQAAATLDIAFYVNKPLKSFSIPVMNVESAYWESFFPWPITYKLGNNEFLVTLSGSDKDQHYSYHLNYSDYSTLQYLPAYQASLNYDKKIKGIGEVIEIQLHKPAQNELKIITKPTYVLFINAGGWHILYYAPRKRAVPIDLEMIPGSSNCAC